MVRRIVARLILISLVFLPFLGAHAADSNNRDRDFRVMTRNMDAGSDFLYVINAAQTDPNNYPGLIGAITQTYLEMHVSGIPQRADGIAGEIERTRPLLVGLQEVTLLRTGKYNEPATIVLDDGLASLLLSLHKRGLYYTVAALQQNADITLPALDPSLQNLISVRLTDYDAVLVRTDVSTAEFKLQGAAKQHFEHYLALPVAGLSVPIYRGWIEVDAKIRGKNFRFVTTHLETFSPDYQQAQTDELIAGPLNTKVPVILAGDLNSDAIDPSFANGPAWGMLTGAGFSDVWSELRPNVPGVTWNLFQEDKPFGPAAQQRIDLILVKNGGIAPEFIFRTGTTPVAGAFSSDHTGVVAGLELLPHE